LKRLVLVVPQPDRARRHAGQHCSDAHGCVEDGVHAVCLAGDLGNLQHDRRDPGFLALRLERARRIHRRRA